MTPQEFNKAMGAVIDRERKTRGLTLEMLGQSQGISYQQIQKFCSGKNGCSAYRVQRFAEIFQVSAGYIYEQAGVSGPECVPPPQPNAADNDGFLAARYVGRIADPKLRSNIVDFARKLAYSGSVA